MSGTEPAALGAFTKKIGPLPGWAWVLIVVGAAYGVFLWRRRGAAAGNTAGPAAVPAAAPQTGFSSADPAPGTNNYSGQVNTLPVGQPANSTNASWGKAVTDFLVGTGNYSPIDVSNALAHYLTGAPLTDQEAAIVNTAVKQFQTPPEGVLPVTVAPAPHKYVSYEADSATQRTYGVTASGDRIPLGHDEWVALGKPAWNWFSSAPGAPAPAPAPAPTPAPAPAPAYHSYTVVPGDSLSGIAMKFWGNYDWQRLYRDNAGAVGGDPNLIHPGLVLKVAN